MDPTYLSSEQTTAAPSSPTVAADILAIDLASSDWYSLVTLYNSGDYVKAVAAQIEGMTKLYLADMSDTSMILVTSTGSADAADDLATSAYARTATMYHPSPANMMAAAWLGKVSPILPGADNWAYKTLAGVSPVKLNATHIDNLRDRNSNYYYTVKGRNITFPGTTTNGSADNGYIDVIRSLDWARDDMQSGVFEVLAAATKVPYTKRGIAMVENAMRASLQRGVARGVWSDDPAPIVTMPKLSEISAGDKTARILPDCKFFATLAGAINKVEIIGVVSV
jgi:hypothetical protein